MDMGILISTIVKEELSTLAKNCNYVVENEAGVRFEIYARNDKAFYRKVALVDWYDKR